MRKLVGLLVALALILSLAVTTIAVTVPVDSATGASISAEGIAIPFTPDANGVLTVTISGNPGYHITVANPADDSTVGLPKSGKTQKVLDYDLVGGTAYEIRIAGYNAAAWDYADSTITYDISFESTSIAVEPIEIEKSNVVLNLGENNVSLLENTIVSLYEFTPAEPGIYTFTANGADIATYGYAAWNLIASGTNGVIEHTATAADQTILIGLTAETASVNVLVEKTGVYTPPVQIQYEDYVPTNTVVSEFEEPAGLENIDITQEQNVVLGDDGYYHLGTANGPIVYVNLNTNQFTLAMLYNAGAPITMRGIYTDENGDPHYYDFMNMITSLYYNYSREYDYHPLNTDLMIFLKAYGGSQGWYNANTSSFDSITSGDFNEESAWLAGCYIVPVPAEPENPTNPTEPSAPATEPSAPATEPSAPATEPSAPATEPSAPATEPSAPATEPSAPATEPSAPATEPSAPATEPSAPATEPSAPATEPSAPATEPEADEPTDEPTADLDMTEVEATLEIIDSLDLGIYTEESMLALTEALEAYYAVLNDPNVDQAMIDQANAALLSAIENLVEVDENASTEPETPSEDDNTGNEEDDTDDVPKTGSIGIIGAVVAMAFSAMGGVAIAKKKEF